MAECSKAEREWLDAAMSDDPLVRKNLGALRHAVAMEKLPPEAVELAVSGFAAIARGQEMLDKAFAAMKAVDFACNEGDAFYRELSQKGRERAGL